MLNEVIQTLGKVPRGNYGILFFDLGYFSLLKVLFAELFYSFPIMFYFIIVVSSSPFFQKNPNPAWIDIDQWTRTESSEVDSNESGS